MNLTLLASNFIHTFVLPPAGLFVLLAIGLFVHVWQPRIGRMVVGGALILFYILCTPAGADLLVAPLENLTTPLRAGSEAGAGAIVVLAAGRLNNAPEYAGASIPDYIALARLRYAARLQHATGLPLLVTGGNRSKRAPFISKAEEMALALREDFRTPVQWVESYSENTAENAGKSAKILHDEHIERILLVTDAMHMPRAERMFAATGLKVVPAPTMFFRMSECSFADFACSCSR